jgi:hypothetical protein
MIKSGQGIQVAFAGREETKWVSEGILPGSGKRAQVFDSLPIWSLTAPRKRCLHPRYRSVVCTEA